MCRAFNLGSRYRGAAPVSAGVAGTACAAWCRANSSSARRLVGVTAPVEQPGGTVDVATDAAGSFRSTAADISARTAATVASAAARAVFSPSKPRAVTGTPSAQPARRLCVSHKTAASVRSRSGDATDTWLSSPRQHCSGVCRGARTGADICLRHAQHQPCRAAAA